MSAWHRLNTRYGNAPVTTGCAYGYTHRSKLESSVCQQIYLREKAGEVKHVAHEVQIYLSRARILYIADFQVIDNRNGKDLFIEAKGFANDRWPMIKKLWKFYGKGPLEIWKGSYLRPVLVEVIVPCSTNE